MQSRLGFRLQHSRPLEAIRIRTFPVLAPVYGLLLRRARTPQALKRAVEVAIPGGSHQKLNEITAFLRFIAEQRPETICEIGIADGGTNILLGWASPATRLVVGIDIHVRHERMLRALRPKTQRLELIEGASCDGATVARLEEALAGDLLDVLFIDGGHLYDDVRDDFQTYRRLVRPGGVIAFHDITPDARAPRGATSRLVGDVPRFWREIRDRFEHVEFVDPDDFGCFGIGAIINDPARG